MQHADVIVIGAGAAGLAAARRLAGAGLTTVVLEARPRLGGRGWTHTVDGMPLDLGCGWLHSADENEWSGIASAGGFTIDKTPPPWNRHGGNLSWPAERQRDFRNAIDAFYERLDARAEERDQPAIAALEEGNPWNGLLNAMSTWINGAELPHISVHDWSNYRDTGVNWRVSEGYGALVSSLAAKLDVRLGCPVSAIDHSGARLRIETAQGAITSRAAIITVPTDLIAGGHIRFTPDLPAKREAAEYLPLGLDDKLFLKLATPDDFPPEKRVFGATDTARTGSFHLRPFGRPVIEVYFGGALARELEADGDAAFAAFAIAQLVTHFGGDIRKGVTPLAVSSWARDPFARGAYSYAKPGYTGMRAALAAPVDDRLFFAGEATSTFDFSTAHGAYRTGVRAAEEALAALTPQR